MSSAFRGPAIVLMAVFVLAGCGGTGTAVPLGAMTQSQAHQASGSSGDLLYVVLGHYLSIYSYPHVKRLKIIDTGTWLGIWGASNPNTGDMCFDNYGQVILYAHGATQPYLTIAQPPSAETFDCAFDPTTNNLAITYNGGSDNSWVSVYSSPYDGSPTEYSDPGMTYIQWAAYDATGDLFVDGENASGGEILVDELPKGSSSFIELKPNQELAPIGPLQWDGRYLTMTVQNVIYRFTVSGSGLKVIGKTAYDHLPESDTFTILGSTAFGRGLHDGRSGGRHLGFWRYPNGRKPFNLIRIFRSPEDKEYYVDAATVSVAPSGTRIDK